VSAAPGLLHFTRTGNGEPLVIVHGLFGSGKNWRSLGQLFSNHFEVFTVDLRNHGESFHHDEMGYEVMAEDLFRLLTHLEISSCRLIGHSMGGKTSILLAFQHPDLISRLVVADIAPVPYSHAFDHLIDPLLALALDQYESRSAVDQALQENIPDDLLRGFLLQNLERNDQHWRWRVNWPAIKKNLLQLTGFPDLGEDWQINTPTLFIRGEHSDYIGANEEAVIAAHFRQATISTVATAGHWLHAEQPQQFASQALDFLLD
jgi:pimeloyl-ACP methyl ester carboxylesterase